MYRRTILGAGAGLALARPVLAQGSAAHTLRFIPQADVTAVDPMSTTSYGVRNHGHMCWDTLYGLDTDFVPRPQLAEGHAVEQDGLRWVFTLREGTRFHDGEPIRAADAVASIRRWARLDSLGQSLAERTEAMRALDDRRFEIRLKTPFGVMLAALGKPSSYPCFIYPERFAEVDPARPFTEVVGSGPYRFLRDEFVSGSRVAYAKNDAYVPRQDASDWASGGKVAHFPRIERHILPDPATAAAALQSGEIDWWEQPTADLFPLVARNRNVTVDVINGTGLIGIFRPNHLTAPFNNPAVRRAVITAVNQIDFMTAVIGDATVPGYQSLKREGIGFFAPESPSASTVGLDRLKKSVDAARAELQAAGAMGAKLVLMNATDLASINAATLVGADLFRRMGFDVDLVSTDWGTLVARRASKNAIDQGGWSGFFTFWSGVDHWNPASHASIRGHGDAAWPGWPTIPAIEAQRNAWFDAPNEAAAKAATTEMQRIAFDQVPYVPTGMYYQPTAYRRNLTGMLKGQPPLFWNVRRG